MRFLHFYLQIQRYLPIISAIFELLTQVLVSLLLVYMVGRCVGAHPGLSNPSVAGSNPAPTQILGTSISKWGFHQSDGALYSARRCNGVHPGLISPGSLVRFQPWRKPLQGAFIRKQLSPDRGGLFSYVPQLSPYTSNSAYLKTCSKKTYTACRMKTFPSAYNARKPERRFWRIISAPNI